MASLYEMAQGPDFDPVESFFAGRNARAQDKFNQNKLAELARMDQARPLMGQALGGDTNAFKSLLSLDPNSAMEVGKYQSAQAKAQREISDAEKQQIVGALYAADTPEKWAQTIDWLKSQGHDVEPEAMDFANREALMGASLGPAKMMDADQWEKGFGLNQFNAQTSRMNAEKDAQQAVTKRRTQITEVDGQRVVVDMDSGEIVQRLGAAPVRGKSGLSPTEFKELRESENELVNLEGTVKNLETALSLAPQVFDGMGAGALTFIGSKVPGGGNLVDPQKANLTAQYQSIMTPEAINMMASTLKGATTDFELRKFENIISDPEQPNNIKVQVIQRMLQLAKNKSALESQRVNDLRRKDAPQGQGNAYPGADGITGADIGGGFEPQGGASGWNEQDLPQIIQDAQDAIQQGADPQAVIEDMIANGVNADYARTLLNGQ